jgi:hypothetical protein
MVKSAVTYVWLLVFFLLIILLTYAKNNNILISVKLTYVNNRWRR